MARKYLTPDELKNPEKLDAASGSAKRRSVVNLSAAHASPSRRPPSAHGKPSPAAREDAPTAEIKIVEKLPEETPPPPAPVQAKVEVPPVQPPAPEEEPAPATPRLPRDRTQVISKDLLRDSAPDQPTRGDATTISGIPGPALSGIPKIPKAGYALAPAPPIVLGQDVLDYMDLHLPMTPMPLSTKLNEKFKTLADKNTAYTVGEILAHGAECILYNGRLAGENFCIKSIRSWLDKFLGNKRTRLDRGKLGNISYATKVRHLSNEYHIGTLLQTDEAVQTPVHIYGLRKVSRFGLELGWDLLMERIYGIDLSDKGLLKALTIEEKVSVCIHICQAIEMLHLRNIIHLDIKPSNFMLERSGRIRLIDFGISVQSGVKSSSVAGTAGYFSPEQLAREKLSEVTDIFALGITFSIIFGAKPLAQSAKDAMNKSFRNEATLSMRENGTAIGDIPDLADFRPLAEVIRACASYKKENRPSSCRAIIKQLKAAAKKCEITPA